MIRLINGNNIHMSQRTLNRLYQAGITAMNITVIIGSIVIVLALGYEAWQYFSGDTVDVVNKNGVLYENRNGTLVQTATAQRSVRGFFEKIAFDWRPVQQAAAAEGGITIERYQNQLPLGTHSSATMFLDADVFDQETNVNSNTNVNGNENTNVQMNGNTNGLINENDNVNQNNNSNDNSNVNNNVNVDINQNANGNTNANSNNNTNTNENINENRNVPVNENTNATINQNVNVPVNENVNVSVNENNNTNDNENNNNNANENVNAEQPGSTDVISAEEWMRTAPRGHAYMQANWFCSAAFVHPGVMKSDGTPLPLGDFTGDCNNPAVVVKGNFLPVLLTGVDLSKPVVVRISADWYDGAHTKLSSNDPSLCSVDYIRGAGHRDVFAAQYTCGDAINSGATNNSLQFTIYAFPDTWSFPSDPASLYTDTQLASDADGDGLTLKQELKLSTNPNNWDTEYDNLGDFEEVNKYTTDPTKADTDGDGYKDYVEVNSKNNPLGSGPATQEQLRQWDAGLDQPGKARITGVTAAVNGTSVMVQWTTDLAADGIVNYGTSDAYGTYRNDTSFMTRHSITIPGIRGQTLHYAIRSCTLAPNAACASTNDATIAVP